MKYRVLVASTIPEIEKLVNLYLSEGWIPTGGIYNTDIGFYQAMILTEPRIQIVPNEIDIPSIT